MTATAGPVPPTPPPSPPPSRPLEEEAEEEVIECRICRGEDGPLISPCACTGSIGHCHLACLLEWLRHSDQPLRGAPICGVCQQPFSLRVRGPTDYFLELVRSLLSPGGKAAVRAALKSGVTHLAEERCCHISCFVVRVALVVGVLQLCLWEGQILMMFLYAAVRGLLLVDSVLDELLVPAGLLPFLHVALPPLCEVAPRKMAVAARKWTTPSLDDMLRGGSAAFELGRAYVEASCAWLADLPRWWGAAVGSSAPSPPTPRARRKPRARPARPTPTATGGSAPGLACRVSRGALPGCRKPPPPTSAYDVGLGFVRAYASAVGGYFSTGFRWAAGHLNLAAASLTPPLPRRGVSMLAAVLRGSEALQAAAAALLGGAADHARHPGVYARQAHGELRPAPRPTPAEAAAHFFDSIGSAQQRRCEAAGALYGASGPHHSPAAGGRFAAPAAAAADAASATGLRPYLSKLTREIASTFLHGEGRVKPAWLLPLDGDALLLACCILALNLMLASAAIGHDADRHRRWAARLRRFGHALCPEALPELLTLDDVGQLLLHLGCAAYGGRVALSHLGWMDSYEAPLDFTAGSGLALHAAVGLGALGVWELVCEAIAMVEADFARWRWSPEGVADDSAAAPPAAAEAEGGGDEAEAEAERAGR